MPSALEGMSQNLNSVEFYDTTNAPTMTKEAYARSITASKFVLCPRGYGPNSVRMYETLALGRIPIIISDGFKLPLEQQIPYKKFCIAVDESKLDQIPSIVDNFFPAAPC